ncbi:hypothetical protein ACFQJ8_09755 [Halocatena marina]|uniref:hypothetical protein n=1 Tax=Halocatena marina TaxID=2934937 RepID=UPI003607302C
MTVSEAVAFFEKPTLQRTLEALDDVGLGYLTLGQSLPTLSGANANASNSRTSYTRRGASTCSMSRPLVFTWPT